MEDTVVKRLMFPGLQEMRLHQTRLPGDSLAPFTNLRHLDLSHNIFFDDRGLRHTAKMPALTKLYLEDTSITDQGLKNLSGLIQLSELNLNGTKTTDAGLAPLSGLTNLRRLDLVGTNITDAGLEYLMRMTQLEKLTLYRTRISNAGLAQLIDAQESSRSRCAIHARDRGGREGSPEPPSRTYGVDAGVLQP